MTRVFEKNRRAIRHGNHVSNIDAEYCTLCHDDLAHPLHAAVCKDCNPQCPHMREELVDPAQA